MWCIPDLRLNNNISKICIMKVGKHKALCGGAVLRGWNSDNYGTSLNLGFKSCQV